MCSRYPNLSTQIICHGWKIFLRRKKIPMFEVKFALKIFILSIPLSRRVFYVLYRKIGVLWLTHFFQSSIAWLQRITSKIFAAMWKISSSGFELRIWENSLFFLQKSNFDINLIVKNVNWKSKTDFSNLKINKFVKLGNRYLAKTFFVIPAGFFGQNFQDSFFDVLFMMGWRTVASGYLDKKTF